MKEVWLINSDQLLVSHLTFALKNKEQKSTSECLPVWPRLWYCCDRCNL